MALIHLDTLLRSAIYLCDRDDRAHDAVQETFLNAWKYWHTFEPGTNCRAWLFRILFNVIKKKGTTRKPVVPWEDSDHQNVLAFDPTTQLEEFEVREAFRQLSNDHRQVMILVAVEEMTYKEAATILRVPVGTVMSRLSRARADMRRMLERDDPRMFRRAT